jgi:hypothetical protein
LFGEPDRWVGRLASVITLAAPLFGTDLGLEGDLLGALGFGALLPGGQGVRELIARGRDPRHRAAVERMADRLRSLGVNLLTLADPVDIVVTPEEAIIAPPAERDRFLVNGPRATWTGGVGVPLGHGPLLSDTLAWVRMARAIGRQVPRAGASPGA